MAWRRVFFRFHVSPHSPSQYHSLCTRLALLASGCLLQCVTSHLSCAWLLDEAVCRHLAQLQMYKSPTLRFLRRCWKKWKGKFRDPNSRNIKQLPSLTLQSLLSWEKKQGSAEKNKDFSSCRNLEILDCRNQLLPFSEVSKKGLAGRGWRRTGAKMQRKLISRIVFHFS